MGFGRRSPAPCQPGLCRSLLPADGSRAWAPLCDASSVRREGLVQEIVSSAGRASCLIDLGRTQAGFFCSEEGEMELTLHQNPFFFFAIPGVAVGAL